MMIKRLLIKQLRILTLWLNKYYAEAGILHFKSNNGKYIYLVILGVHCKDTEKFYKLFPNSTQVTERKFDKLYKKGIEIVCVGDEADIIELEKGQPERTITSPDLKLN